MYRYMDIITIFSLQNLFLVSFLLSCSLLTLRTTPQFAKAIKENPVPCFLIVRIIVLTSFH